MGRKALGWDVLIVSQNSGTRYKLKKGPQVTVWESAFYERETWLEVTESPYAAYIWVCESDLTRVDLANLQDSSLYRNCGAESLFRITGVKSNSKMD